MSEIVFSSARELVRRIKDGELSATEAVQAHLNRIRDINPKLNAVVQLVEERALKEAQAADEAQASGKVLGPLHGVPITIKDSLDTEGVVSTGGTTGRATFVPEEDATVVARLRSAGAIIIGKTNTPELTLAGETDNLIYGKTNNPYDLARSPGGSSGGAAAIIAAGGSPLDIGSDTGGSIRGPAHFCGIAGIKPTSGRVPRTGHIVPYGLGALDSLTQLGPMARFVDDLTLVLPIIVGPDGKDPAIVPMPLLSPDDVDLHSLRIAVHSDNGRVTPVAEMTEAVYSAAKVLEDAGCKITETMPESLKHATELYDRLNGADGKAWVRRLLNKAGTSEAGWLIERDFRTTAAISSAEFSELLEELDEYRSAMLGFMHGYDAILCPGGALPALPHGTTYHEPYSDYSHTSAYNLTGWPGAVVRGGTNADGMPLGVQVVAHPWREDVTLAVTRYLEDVLGGWQSPPI